MSIFKVYFTSYNSTQLAKFFIARNISLLGLKIELFLKTTYGCKFVSLEYVANLTGSLK